MPRGVTMVFLKAKRETRNNIFELTYNQVGSLDQSTVTPLRSSLTLHWAPYTYMKNVMHPNEVDHIELTLHHGKRRADRQRIAQ